MEHRAWLTFVIVRAGATGVELSGQLAFLSREMLAGEFRAFDSRDARIPRHAAAPGAEDLAHLRERAW